MDLHLERMGDQQSNSPWLSVPPSSPRISKVNRPPRSPSTVIASPYSAVSNSKKRQKEGDINFADIFSSSESSWLTEPVKRPGHRRSASDSVTFLESMVNPVHSSTNGQTQRFGEACPPSSRPLNDFGELPDPEADSVMAWLNMEAIHSSSLKRGDPRGDSESVPGKPAPKHRRGASEGAVSNWLTDGDFTQADFGNDLRTLGLASVTETGETTHVPASEMGHTPRRRGHQRTTSEPPASWSEDASFASEEDIKPCISGRFLDMNGMTEDNRLGGLATLKSELGISGPLKESELELLQMDPKKAKRVLANRQSAQKSRIRKLHYISELEKRVNSLEADLKTLQPRVTFLDQERAKLNGANSGLKQKIAALQQETGFKDALNDALQKEVDRLRQTLTSSAQVNGRSSLQLGSNGPQSHHAPFPSELNGEASRVDFSVPALVGSGDFEPGAMDLGQSRDSFQHFLDGFNGSGSFMLDSM